MSNRLQSGGLFPEMKRCGNEGANQSPSTEEQLEVFIGQFTHEMGLGQPALARWIILYLLPGGSLADPNDNLDAVSGEGEMRDGQIGRSDPHPECWLRALHGGQHRRTIGVRLDEAR